VKTHGYSTYTGETASIGNGLRSTISFDFSQKPFIAAQKRQQLTKLIKDELSKVDDLPQLDSTDNTSLPAALAFAGDEGNASILGERHAVAGESGIAHKGVSCDGCKDGVDIKGPRFGCGSCVNLDLCQGCFGKYERNELGLERCRGHRFYRVRRVGESCLAPGEREQWFEELKRRYVANN